MTTQTSPIAQSNNFIVLDKYTPKEVAAESYQSEHDLEEKLIADLKNQGYEYLESVRTPEALLVNLRTQLQTLNSAQFTDAEWQRFVETWLDAPNEGLIEKSRKVHDDYIHDFVFDDGRIQNIYLFDKNHLARNKVQVINQVEQSGSHANRYDVTILVNGLPLVHIELKKRGVAIKEAFNQVHRYSKESFNSDNSLFKYIQLFIISNGTDSRYFANTTQRNKNSFDFSMNWAEVNNEPIKDLTDFTATFLEKATLLSVLLRYSVLDVSDTLLIMRPYQIAAAERILRKINSSHHAKTWSTPESGGYIWHTTGSGKTLTSFKAARLATELDNIDKVFFVVDRKDLDYQTMKEYQRFSPDSVNGSDSTEGLKRNLTKDDNKIVVTTIQKLNNLMRSETKLPIYNKHVVFIFDECHRSQFGEAQKNLTKKFKKYYQFGFTGTPIFADNASGTETTQSVFGRELHSYVITDAIRDEKVLKFKVDYNDVRPQFTTIEREQDEAKLSAAENKQALLHPQRINQITQYILNNFSRKTHRLRPGSPGFNAMFAVSSVDAAKMYYESFKTNQQDSERPLKVATIFSYAANEEQAAAGTILDESFNVSALDSTAKEFLSAAINDYNEHFATNFSVDSQGFQNYYRDLAKRVKTKEIDLLIVVGMFLTGFDAPQLNTLFVDKNLRYHGLIQAFSRTNRIFDATKSFGNIVTFRDLEEATEKAIQLFGESSTRSVVLEKSFTEYMGGFTDAARGEERRGFTEIVADLNEHFPEPTDITTETDKKKFVTVFGEYLRAENALQNFDEYEALKDLQQVDTTSEEALADFQIKHHLTDEEVQELQTITLPPERKLQDYRSVYNDIREWRQRQQNSDELAQSTVDWADAVFEVELLKSQEINLEYILELLLEQHQKSATQDDLVDEMRRTIRSSIGNRAKESLIVDFIEETDLTAINDKADMMEKFFAFARVRQGREAQDIISEEGLNVEAAQRYLSRSLQHGYASESGTALNEALPKMRPLDPKYLTTKQSVFQRIAAFVEKFKGVGGTI